MTDYSDYYCIIYHHKRVHIDNHCLLSGLKPTFDLHRHGEYISISIRYRYAMNLNSLDVSYKIMHTQIYIDNLYINTWDGCNNN